MLMLALQIEGPTATEQVWLDIVGIAVLVAALVTGLVALRNRNRRR
ncbi:hypothetical protein [Actinokineospora sp. NBRC 105648]|nr:hypothetical protein [Actinokineospora sp. NBRC 105648]GLZ38633.1 hypothetical protein Acsp05_22570 [Actinokineospora sp. NBRC 105648]